MTLRVEVSGTETITYTQAWNAENRLSVVTNTVSGAVTRFVYDGDGNRVLREQPDGSVTAYLGAVEVTLSGTERLTTSYYFAGSQRIAMREGVTLTYLHGDHLGSASLATDNAGAQVSTLRYTPFGEIRYGDAPTDFRFTGQREEEFGLYDYGARLYSPSVGRFVSADTLVPNPGNPQTLNRYTYALNNSLKYTDPSGHCAWLPFAIILAGSYVAGRVTYDAMVEVFPNTLGRDRRDQIGGRLVTDVSEVIQQQATTHAVDPTLIGAILRHESAAAERRVLTLWPTMQPGFVANTAEFFQSHIQGDTASIGPAQMQLQRAQELEEMGYVTTRKNNHQRRLALLGKETAVEYVAGMLNYLSDQLQQLDGYAQLDLDQQQRLLLIAYNWGWTSEFRKALEERGFAEFIDWWPYDNETLDEYLRWSGE